MRRLLPGAVVLLLALRLNGCASVAHGPMERIAIDTNPGGADVKIVCSNQVVASGVTPTSLSIPRRGDPCEVALSKEGYESARVPLERGFSGRYWGNIGMAAAIPAGVVMLFGDNSDDDSLAPALFGVGVAGCIGLFLDRVNGSMYDHDPAHVSLQLQLRAARIDDDRGVVSAQTSSSHE